MQALLSMTVILHDFELHNNAMHAYAYFMTRCIDFSRSSIYIKHLDCVCASLFFAVANSLHQFLYFNFKVKSLIYEHSIDYREAILI